MIKLLSAIDLVSVVRLLMSWAVKLVLTCRTSWRDSGSWRTVSLEKLWRFRQSSDPPSCWYPFDCTSCSGWRLSAMRSSSNRDRPWCCKVSRWPVFEVDIRFLGDFVYDPAPLFARRPPIASSHRRRTISSTKITRSVQALEGIRMRMLKNVTMSRKKQ